MMGDFIGSKADPKMM